MSPPQPEQEDPESEPEVLHGWFGRWSLLHARPGGEEGGRATRPAEPSSRRSLEAPKDKRGLAATRGPRTELRSRRSSFRRGVTTLATFMAFRSGRAVRPNRRPSPRGARFTGHAKVRLWSRRRGSVAPRRVTCRCRGLPNPPSPPTPASVSLDFDSCPGQPRPAKSVAAPP